MRWNDAYETDKRAKTRLFFLVTIQLGLLLEYNYHFTINRKFLKDISFKTQQIALIYERKFFNIFKIKLDSY